MDWISGGVKVVVWRWEDEEEWWRVMRPGLIEREMIGMEE